MVEVMEMRLEEYLCHIIHSRHSRTPRNLSHTCSLPQPLSKAATLHWRLPPLRVNKTRGSNYNTTAQPSSQHPVFLSTPPQFHFQFANLIVAAFPCCARKRRLCVEGLGKSVCGRYRVLVFFVESTFFLQTTASHALPCLE